MTPKNASARVVAALLFGSGACALVYQAAWFRELRLVFGASTAASAAVLGVFMAGLGVGGRLLGARADRAKNPLLLYANLELAAAALAAVTPLLAAGVRAAYVGLGGSASLGSTGATVVRLLLSAVVLGGPTVVMGGTLPAAVRAIERDDDAGRHRVALLYGVNTFGAVVGNTAATFLLFEVFGTRMTLWFACLVNALVGMLARSFARGLEASTPDDDDAGDTEEPLAPTWLPPAAAAVIGFAFMLMEIVWYRMLAPLLGGSSYTFGLVLTVALAGIGLGGALQARGKAPSSLRAFALTCGFEALLLGIPYALGDRIAVLALLLRPMAAAGFAAQVGAWIVVAAIVVFPAAVVAGAQFPLVIGLYGRGRARVGRHVGHAYLANTLGGIAGSLAGGFGILPLLSATGTWRVVVVLLAATAAFALVFARGRAERTVTLAAAASAALAALSILATGPTAAWRHTGIGAGRASTITSSAGLVDWARRARLWTEWEVDGVESGVALSASDGYAFVVNGKVDGNAAGDAPTQVMSGLVASLVHGAPKRAFVVGLGTGSTAGWLAAIPTMERVDVIEIEPAITKVARACAPVNAAAMDNPKMHVTFGDAREALLVTRDRYDVVFSEPSNPFRAGISSLYTREFYQAVRARLAPGGVFLQWLQDYEVDAEALVSVAASLRAVFGDLHAFETETGDILFLAREKAEPFDVAKMRALAATEPYATALRAVWRTSSLEGFFAHYVANDALLAALAQTSLPNTDDENHLEYAFARTVGKSTADRENLAALAARMGGATPPVAGTGALDADELDVEKWVVRALGNVPLGPVRPGAPPRLEGLHRVFEAFAAKRRAACASEWTALGRERPSPGELAIVLECAAVAGDEKLFDAWIDRYDDPVERAIFRAGFLRSKGRWPEVVGALEAAFTAHRTYPWSRRKILGEAMDLAREAALRDPASAPRLYAALAKPFSVRASDDIRARTAVDLAVLSRDAGRCVEALSALEPNTPWERELLKTRVDCYRATGDGRAALAEKELRRFLADEPVPLGAYLR